jgi:hypothetical protein
MKHNVKWRKAQNFSRFFLYSKTYFSPLFYIPPSLSILHFNYHPNSVWYHCKHVSSLDNDDAGDDSSDENSSMFISYFFENSKFTKLFLKTFKCAHLRLILIELISNTIKMFLVY